MFSNYYFSLIGSSIQKIYYNGTFQIVAGNPSSTGNVDGVGIAAKFFNSLYGDFDPSSNSIFIGDSSNIKRYNITGTFLYF